MSGRPSGATVICRLLINGTSANAFAVAVKENAFVMVALASTAAVTAFKAACKLRVSLSPNHLIV
jgi:hypothetical protein